MVDRLVKTEKKEGQLLYFLRHSAFPSKLKGKCVEHSKFLARQNTLNTLPKAVLLFVVEVSPSWA